MVVNRGSFIEAYPLFGLNLQNYDSLIAGKLEILLKISVRIFGLRTHNDFSSGSGTYKTHPAPQCGNSA